MKYFLFFALSNLILSNKSIAQDYHLSQFDANPLNLNPALTGERLTENKGLQINFNYRNQTSNFTNGSSSYKTFAEGIDFPVSKKFSIGQYFTNNKSVNNTFNVTNIMISSSYKIISNTSNDDKQNLSVGLQVGVINKNYSPQNFTYGNQYSANSESGFDRDLPSGENINIVSNNQLRANFGVYYRTKLNADKITVYSGFSVNNIAKSKEIVGGNKIPMTIRYNLNFGGMYKVDEKISLFPNILYMNQNKAHELNIGVLMQYKMNTIQTPIVGLSWRNKNAVIVHVGLKIKGNTFRASYCFINSYLAEFRNRGLEFSIVHTSLK